MNPVVIGSRRELLWDDVLVDKSRTTAKFMLHTPQIQEVVLSFGEPWEGDGTNSFSIIKDGNLYRMYYLGWEMLNKDVTAHAVKKLYICYAESFDGLKWTKPKLNICKFDGSGDNNILLDDCIDMMHFFIDENPACPKEERYKAIGKEKGKGKEKILACWISSDGLHFKKGWQMTKEGMFDTHNIAFWVPEQNQYIGYIRDFHDVPGEDWNAGVRDVRWMSSPDFKTWTVPQPLDFCGGEDYPLYTNEIQLYPRAPHMYIGFPSRYVERHEWTENYDQLAGAELRKRICKVHPRYGLTTTDCVLMTSRDGKHFHRFDEALIRPGVECVNNWVYGDCYPATGLVETKSTLENAPDEYSLYCFENHWRMIPAQLRRYSFRKDGLVSYHADYGECKLVTVPIVFTGTEMELNFSTSARGYIYVKVVSRHDGDLISCELFGDTLERIVPFNGDLSGFSDKEVVLEFTFRDADLFSYRFR